MAKSGGFLSGIVHNILIRTALYYLALFAFATWLYRLPQAQTVIQGSLEALVANGFPGLGKASSLEGVGGLSVNASTLAWTTGASMVGAFLLALPVAWVYTLTRKKRGYDQSVVQTLILLPVLVAGVVVLVKYSLALAFSLAGIVAAVRFRNTLDDSKDAVYIFLATTIGLAAGVQLPIAAVISVIFNLITVALWYTDFGKAGAAMEGIRAEKQLEEARQRLRQTGSFVALLDDEIFADMTPDQLDLAADVAWRRRRRMETDDVPDEIMQKRDVLLRIRTNDPDAMRAPVEVLFEEFLKKWRFGGVVKEPDGTKIVEYAVQLKKTTRSSDLIDALNTKSQVIDAEIK